jgi:hypothetical protein
MVENGRVEKVLVRRCAPGFRVTREGADPSGRPVKPDKPRSSRTTRVQLDNLSSPHGPDRHP